MISYATYLTELSAWETQKREARRAYSASFVTSRQDRPYHAQEIAEQQPGRAYVIRWQRCARLLLQKCATHHQPGFVLTSEQLRNLTLMRNAHIPNLYGTAEALKADEAFLERFTLMKRVYDALALLAGRRSGKSLVEALCCAITALSQMQGNSVVYNLTGRQAREWLRQYVKFIDLLKEDMEFGWTLEAANVNEFHHLRLRQFDTISTVFSYCGATNSSHAMIARHRRGPRCEREPSASCP